MTTMTAAETEFVDDPDITPVPKSGKYLPFKLADED